MIIYEVALLVDKQIEEKYVPWLEDHVKEMCDLEGFQEAKILRCIDPAEEGKLQFVVHYFLESMDALENYFQKHAERMRGDGQSRFAGKFSAKRRVLKAFH